MVSQEATSRELSLYVHVPFCEQKCRYCSFYSVHGRESEYDAYLEAVRTEWDLICRDRRLDEANLTIATLYLGGGTPSLLGAERLERLLSSLRQPLPWVEDCEVTAELNPEDIDRAQAQRLLASGIGRLSVGIQSFRDEELELLGRRADARQVREALDAIREAGCRNLSFDLIYGLPGQTVDQWLQSLQEALSRQPEHLSCYLLTAEEDTILHQLLRGGVVESPLDEVLLQQYKTTGHLAPSAGLEQYEISNFARPGFRCRHNLGTWTRQPYLGLGPAAHSFDGGARWCNVADWPEYRTQVLEQKQRPIRERYRLGGADAAKEMILLGLRLAEGVAWSDLEQAVSARKVQQLHRRVEFLVGTGFLLRDAERLRLSPDAYFVSNSVFVELIRTLEEEEA